MFTNKHAIRINEYSLKPYFSVFCMLKGRLLFVNQIGKNGCFSHPIICNIPYTPTSKKALNVMNVQKTWFVRVRSQEYRLNSKYDI